MLSKAFLTLTCLNLKIAFTRTRISGNFCAIADAHSTSLRGTGHRIQYSYFFLFLSDSISEGLPFNLPTQRLASATCVLLALLTQSSNRLDLYKAYPINTEQLPTSVGIFAKSPFCCGLSSRNMLCISCKPT